MTILEIIDKVRRWMDDDDDEDYATGWREACDQIKIEIEATLTVR